MTNFPVNDKLADDIRRAHDAQERRKSAPPVDLNSVGKLRRKQLIEHFAPDCVSPARGVNPEKHAFWGDKTKHAEYVEQGYEPVIHKGKHVIDGEDPLYRIPFDIYEEGLKMVSLISKHRLGEKSKEVQDSPDALDEKIIVRRSDEKGYEDLDVAAKDTK